MPWQAIFVIAIHSLAFGSLVSFTEKYRAVGLVGDVEKQIGSRNTGTVTQIKIHSQDGGITDAREIVARRQLARIEEARAQEEQRQAAEAAARKEAEIAAKKNQVDDQVQEIAKKKGPGLEKIEPNKKVEETKKTKNKEEQKKNNDNAVKNPQKGQSSATQKTRTTTQTAKSKQAGQAASAGVEGQSAQRKALKGQEAKSAGTSASAFDNIRGDGGGDGAQFNTFDATDIETYRQRVRAIILKRFNPPEHLRQYSCRVSISIGTDGTIYYPTVLEGHDEACKYAIQTINITKKVQAPPPAIYDKVKYMTLFFTLK